MNGQEVALRLISFVFAWQAFSDSPKSTTERTGNLQGALAAHARRIISTLPYARSQRNNHLLSEAAGLYTAGLMLPNLPDAHRWKRTGWNLFIRGMRDQITPIRRIHPAKRQLSPSHAATGHLDAGAHPAGWRPYLP